MEVLAGRSSRTSRNPSVEGFGPPGPRTRRCLLKGCEQRGGLVTHLRACACTSRPALPGAIRQEVFFDPALKLQVVAVVICTGVRAVFTAIPDGMPLHGSYHPALSREDQRSFARPDRSSYRSAGGSIPGTAWERRRTHVDRNPRESRTGAAASTPARLLQHPHPGTAVAQAMRAR